MKGILPLHNVLSKTIREDVDLLQFESGESLASTIEALSDRYVSPVKTNGQAKTTRLKSTLENTSEEWN